MSDDDLETRDSGWGGKRTGSLEGTGSGGGGTSSGCSVSGSLESSRRRSRSGRGGIGGSGNGGSGRGRVSWSRDRGDGGAGFVDGRLGGVGDGGGGGRGDVVDGRGCGLRGRVDGGGCVGDGGRVGGGGEGGGGATGGDLFLKWTGGFVVCFGVKIGGRFGLEVVRLGGQTDRQNDEGRDRRKSGRNASFEQIAVPREEIKGFRRRGKCARERNHRQGKTKGPIFRYRSGESWPDRDQRSERGYRES